MHSTLEQLRTADPAWWAGLGNISAPALVIDGGAGTAANRVDLDALADAVPDSTRISLAVGHRVWTADPRMFADTVLSFVGE